MPSPPVAVDAARHDDLVLLAAHLGKGVVRIEEQVDEHLHQPALVGENGRNVVALHDDSAASIDLVTHQADRQRQRVPHVSRDDGLALVP